MSQLSRSVALASLVLLTACDCTASTAVIPLSPDPDAGSQVPEVPTDLPATPTEFCAPEIPLWITEPRELGPVVAHDSHQGCVVAQEVTDQRDSSGSSGTFVISRHFDGSVLVEERLDPAGQRSVAARYFFDSSRGVFTRVERGNGTFEEQELNGRGKMLEYASGSLADESIRAVSRFTWDGGLLLQLEEVSEGGGATDRRVANWVYDSEGQIVRASARVNTRSELPERTRLWSYDEVGRPVQLEIEIEGEAQLSAGWQYTPGGELGSRRLLLQGSDQFHVSGWFEEPWSELDTYEGEWLDRPVEASECRRLPVRIEEHRDEDVYRVDHGVQGAPGEAAPWDGHFPIRRLSGPSEWLTEYDAEGRMVRQVAESVESPASSFSRARSFGPTGLQSDVFERRVSHMLTFEYDAEGRLRERQFSVPDSPQSCVWTFSGAGPASYQCEDGRSATFDSEGRMRSRDYQEDDRTHHWEVDYGVGGTTTRGRVEQVMQDWGLYSRVEHVFEHDAMGREVLHNWTQTAIIGRRDGVPPDVGNYEHRTEYDESGNVLSEHWLNLGPNESQSYVWDENARLVSTTTIGTDRRTTTTTYDLVCSADERRIFGF